MPDTSHLNSRTTFPVVRRLLVVAIAGAVAAMALVTWHAHATRHTPRASHLLPSGNYTPDPRVLARANTEQRVALLERAVAHDVTTEPVLTSLGFAYIQRARETGDPTLYQRADNAFQRALARNPASPSAYLGVASLHAVRHEFAAALVAARQAHKLTPYSADPLGVEGDALVELGRYPQAFATINHMLALRPGVPSYTRYSYERELLGDRPGAIAALVNAVEVGDSAPEPAAYTRVLLGNLYLANNQLDTAHEAYASALTASPGFAAAEAGMAKIAAARGNFATAATDFQAALDKMPLPEYAIGLGDSYRAEGQAQKAGEADQLVQAMDQLFQANGVNTELDIAVFQLDHHGNYTTALASALRGYQTRKSIDAQDTVAWGYYRTGDCATARTWSDRALRLGTRDGLKLFHRGMIASCLSGHAAAVPYLQQALAANPNFSIRWAPVARELVAR